MGARLRKKRLEKAMWSHEFVCLAKADHEKTPTVMERATLTTLGEYLTLLQKICYCHEEGVHFRWWSILCAIKCIGALDIHHNNCGVIYIAAP